MNYVDPSGHDAIVLKSNFCTGLVGHLAVLIKKGSNWRYLSWGLLGWRSKYINCKANQYGYKSVKNKKVYNDINKRFKRKKSSKKYRKYEYISGNFDKSAEYIAKVDRGESYRMYDIRGVNCSWMVLETLRKGNIGSKKKDTIKHWQWADDGNIMETAPNCIFKRLATLFDVKKENVIGE